MYCRQSGVKLITLTRVRGAGTAVNPAEVIKRDTSVTLTMTVEREKKTGYYCFMMLFHISICSVRVIYVALFTAKYVPRPCKVILPMFCFVFQTNTTQLRKSSSITVLCCKKLTYLGLGAYLLKRTTFPPTNYRSWPCTGDVRFKIYAPKLISYNITISWSTWSHEQCPTSACARVWH